MEQVKHSIAINPYRPPNGRRIGVVTLWLDQAGGRGRLHIHGASLAVLAMLKAFLGILAYGRPLRVAFAASCTLRRRICRLGLLLLKNLLEDWVFGALI